MREGETAPNSPVKRKGICKGSLAWLDHSLPARECNCDGHVRKRGRDIAVLYSLTPSVGSKVIGNNCAKEGEPGDEATYI